MRIDSAILLLLASASLMPAAKTLDFYFIDTEGGQATLMVTPDNQSVLFDTGFPGNNGRDSGRILAAAKDAGVKKLDYLVITHYHRDHVGGVQEIVPKLPVATFVDHGANVETGKGPDELFSDYQKAFAAGKRLVVKPGDKIPLKGVDMQVVSANGEHIAKPLSGAASANPLCAGQSFAEDTGENARSVGTLITFGKFRMINLGDLTNKEELELVCPDNRVGTVDLYLTTHHGLNTSNAQAIVHALKPRVAIMNNGARKGGTPEAYKIIRSSPGLEDLWQLHYSTAGGKDANSPDAFIANLDPACEGKLIKVSVQKDGSFTVTNMRNKYAKPYAAR